MAFAVELPARPRDPKTTTGATTTPPATHGLGIEFPARCVYCLATAEANSRVRLTYRKDKVEGETVEAWQVPYCAKHQSTNARITRINKTAAGVASLSGAAGALVIARSVQAMYLVQTLVFIAAAIPLVLACLLVWALLRSLLARFSLNIRHTGILNATLGFRVSYRKDSDLLRFTFVNPDYARSFARANASRAARPTNGSGPR